MRRGARLNVYSREKSYLATGLWGAREGPREIAGRARARHSFLPVPLPFITPLKHGQDIAGGSLNPLSATTAAENTFVVRLSCHLRSARNVRHGWRFVDGFLNVLYGKVENGESCRLWSAWDRSIPAATAMCNSTGRPFRILSAAQRAAGGHIPNRVGAFAPSTRSHHHHFVLAFHSPIMRPSGSVKSESVPMPGTSCSSTWILPPAATIFLR